MPRLAISAFICQRIPLTSVNGTLHDIFGGPGRTNRAFSRRASGGPLWMFFRGFIKHPVMVGSVIPSSKMSDRQDAGAGRLGQLQLFVEYGPGVGTFTQQILDRLAPDATLLTIDTNPGLHRLPSTASSPTRGWWP
jgi:hypothetical protein